jgi:hypothetical protein
MHISLYLTIFHVSMHCEDLGACLFKSELNIMVILTRAATVCAMASLGVSLFRSYAATYLFS